MRSSPHVTGSYIARVSLGEPAAAAAGRYTHSTSDGLTIYFPPDLRISRGRENIKIWYKKFWFAGWLEIEGAEGRLAIDD